MTPITLEVLPIKSYLLDLQKTICSALEQEDGDSKFLQDPWLKPELQGGGLTCVLEDGPVIEKAAVNFSHVAGQQLPESATQLKPQLVNARFEALGLSLIVHPQNPYAPTTHANLRLFVARKPDQAPIWWFGGGFDLTPYYGFTEDCQHFHQMAKQACDPFGENVYARYKKWADDYFYLKHRNEWRGIGGLFFDDLNEWEFDCCFEFLQSVGHHFLAAYQPILNRRKNIPYGEREKNFQLYRRGRYVEFNLIYDRGTQFGLKFGGRIESILASLPPLVSWHYDWKPEAGSVEARLTEEFLKPRDWINL